MASSQLSFGSGIFSSSEKFEPIIGLDISDSAVKLVELSQSGLSFQLEKYAIRALPKDVISDGNFDVEKLDIIAENIRSAWRGLNTKTRRVALALPTSMAMYRKILLPAGAGDSEIESMVKDEASKFIPFPLDEVNLDYQALGSTMDEVEVMVCAARKEKVEERVSAVGLAGLVASVVDIDIFSASTALELIQQQMPGQGHDKTFAIFDIGANKMHCYVVRNGQPLYFREQSIGGQQLTREIQRRYSLSQEDAEKGKRTMSLPDGYSSELLQPFVNTLAQEVQRVLQFFYTTVSTSLYQKVDGILLVGGCAPLLGLDESVTAVTKISSIIANPFSGMGHSKNINPKSLLLDAASLFNACGLAVRGG